MEGNGYVCVFLFLGEWIWMVVNVWNLIDVVNCFLVLMLCDVGFYEVIVCYIKFVGDFEFEVVFFVFDVEDVVVYIWKVLCWCIVF